MASYLMLHRETGCLLSGYVLGSAQPEEIEKANQRLLEAQSDWRLIEQSLVPCGSNATP